MVFFTGVIALFAVVQAANTYLQWQTAQKAIDASERARLIGVSARFYVIDGKLATVAVKFLNGGKGPAFSIQHDVQHTRDTTAPSTPILAGSELTLISGASTETVVKFTDISKDDIERIFKGWQPFIVWLRIKYSDPFSDNRYTQACWFFNAQMYDSKIQQLTICGPGGQVYR